ncbi:MAG: hypothetical protein ACRDEA_19695, partial [Microcystaceae cyanobacterium]
MTYYSTPSNLQGGHFKRRLHQALLMRGSTDFASVSEYQQLIEQVIGRLNSRCGDQFEQEKALLQPLPSHRLADYQIHSVRV